MTLEEYEATKQDATDGLAVGTAIIEMLAEHCTTFPAQMTALSLVIGNVLYENRHLQGSWRQELFASLRKSSEIAELMFDKQRTGEHGTA